jgi:hypothetical protein
LTWLAAGAVLGLLAGGDLHHPIVLISNVIGGPDPDPRTVFILVYDLPGCVLSAVLGGSPGLAASAVAGKVGPLPAWGRVVAAGVLVAGACYLADAWLRSLHPASLPFAVAVVAVATIAVTSRCRRGERRACR